MARKELSNYQKDVISNYYGNLDTIMLQRLGETDKAQRIENAIDAVLKEGKVRTYDMGGSAGTLDMADAVIGKL